MFETLTIAAATPGTTASPTPSPPTAGNPTLPTGGGLVIAAILVVALVIARSRLARDR